MLRHSRDVYVFLLWGLSVLLGGVVLYNPLNKAGLAGGLRWLTLLVAVVLGGGLVLGSIFAWQKKREYTRQMGLPALILVGVGLLAIGGSVSMFRPWTYDGLAGGLRVLALVGFLVGGGLFVATGFYCYRTRNARLPLTILAGLTGAGVFYPFDESGLLLGVHPLLWVALVILFVTGPPLGVYYGWPRLHDTGTLSAN